MNMGGKSEIKHRQKLPSKLKLKLHLCRKLETVEPLVSSCSSHSICTSLSELRRLYGTGGTKAIKETYLVQSNIIHMHNFPLGA